MRTDVIGMHQLKRRGERWDEVIRAERFEIRNYNAAGGVLVGVGIWLAVRRKREKAVSLERFIGNA